MSRRIGLWLLVLGLLAPLVVFVYRPEAFSPLVQRAFAYPIDVVWLLAYDTLFAMLMWRRAPSKHRIAVAKSALVTCYGMTVAYCLIQTHTLWGVALVVPPISAAIAILVCRSSSTGVSAR
jgi:peptidoglycan/LPS O-acetylase OafA/YrhL